MPALMNTRLPDMHEPVDAHSELPPTSTAPRPVMLLLSGIGLLALLTGATTAGGQVVTPAHPTPRVVTSESQRTAAQDEFYHYIWAPRPGNINNELVGTATIAEELLERYIDLHSAMEFAAAAGVARELIELCPNRPEGYYNLACSLARLHRCQEALAALDQAIDHGWRHLRHTWLDPDLATLRNQNNEAFRERALRMARLEHEERVRPAALRADDWRAIVDDLNVQIPHLLEKFGVPGVTVALVQDGSVVWNAAFGFSNAREQVPMVVHDQFQLHSPVELMAAVAMLQQQQRAGLDFARTLAQADELQLRDRPTRLARGDIPRFVDVDRDIRAQLLSLEHDPTLQAEFRSRAANRSTWPVSQAIPRTLDWLAQAIDHVGGESFYRYCQQYILAVADMQETLFVLPYRQREQRQQPIDDGGRVVLAAPNPELVIGHTRFGTPLTPVFRQDRTAIAPVRTTANDLAQLVASILQADDARPTHDTATSAHRPLPGMAQPLQDVLASPKMRQVGLGMDVHVDQTIGGPRLQVIETRDGIGCLMRWYPGNRSGIVVLFNSENGTDVAVRIAHAALGGE